MSGQAQLWLMRIAGALAAGATYLDHADPAHSGIYQAAIAIFGAVGLILGHTSPSVLGTKS